MQIYTKTPIMIEHIATKYDFFFLHLPIPIVDIIDGVLVVWLQAIRESLFIKNTQC